jgi:hypothetical protein
MKILDTYETSTPMMSDVSPAPIPIQRIITKRANISVDNILDTIKQHNKSHKMI